MDSQACSQILESLKEDSVSRVILVGEAGKGKTWLARKIFERATREESSYISLWLNLNKDLNEKSLYEDIASQLSVFLDNEDDDDDIDDENSEEDNSEDDEEEEQKIQDLMGLKGKILRKLREQKLKAVGNKYLLLVLDDEGSVINEEKVMKDLYLEDFLAAFKPLKILLTRRKGEEDDTCMVKSESHAYSDIKNESHAYSDGEIDSIKSNASDEPHAYSDMENESPATPKLHDSHTIDVSHILHDTCKDDNLVILLEAQLIKNGLLESLEKAWGNDIEFLKYRIVKMSMRLPAAVVVLAKSLNRITPPLSPKHEEAFKSVVLSSFDPDRATSRHNPILQLAYELLKTDDTVNSSIVDCFWHSLSFFEHCGCVHYQELIAHWILEGYFDPVRSVTMAYKDGHDILIELMDRGILKIQEDNVVVPEVAMKNLIDLRLRGLSGRSRIGLAKVCGSDMTKGPGIINQMDGIIEAVQATRKGETVTTVLVSGNRLRRETPEKFFEKLTDLEILGLFELSLYHFVPSLVKLVKLRVLVIRNCDQVKDIEDLKALKRLHAIEISGASSLKEISDDFFMAMPDLRSLHLSGLQIKFSPSSISKLKGLHRLIIRDCPVLEDMPDIQELVNLEVVDVSGACGLQTCFENEKGEVKNKNFYHLTKLQLLDFSESQIERLPMFQDSAVANKLQCLTRLLLRNCSKLRKLPSLKPLSGLQILDISGTMSLMKMRDVCFEDKEELRILNLSGTNLSELATTIEELSNLRELLLKNCTNLEAIPDITKLENLEVIDVSGSTKLSYIEGSFEKMFYLRKVNLYRTQVKTPEVPTESRICCQKSIILVDGTCISGKDWDEVKAWMPSERSEKATSSGAVVKSQEIPETESGEIQSNDSSSSEFSRKRSISKECFHHFPIYRALYQKSIPFVDPKRVLEIHGSNGLDVPRDLDKQALANAEFVSFVDSSSTRLTSIFNEMKSVKGLWVRMCKNIGNLFSGVDDERLGSLEILSITNLRVLDSICSGGGFNNLKTLSIDCCPNITTVFPDASQLPSSLEVLHIKYCEKLERVFGGQGEVSSLTTLCLYELPLLTDVGAILLNLETYKVRNCPNLPPDNDWVVIDRIEASPED